MSNNGSKKNKVHGLNHSDFTLKDKVKKMINDKRNIEYIVRVMNDKQFKTTEIVQGLRDNNVETNEIIKALYDNGFTLRAIVQDLRDNKFKTTEIVQGLYYNGFTLRAIVQALSDNKLKTTEIVEGLIVNGDTVEEIVEGLYNLDYELKDIVQALSDNKIEAKKTLKALIDNGSKVKDIAKALSACKLKGYNEMVSQRTIDLYEDKKYNEEDKKYNEEDKKYNEELLKHLIPLIDNHQSFINTIGHINNNKDMVSKICLDWLNKHDEFISVVYINQITTNIFKKDLISGMKKNIEMLNEDKADLCINKIQNMSMILNKIENNGNYNKEISTLITKLDEKIKNINDAKNNHTQKEITTQKLVDIRKSLKRHENLGNQVTRYFSMFSKNVDQIISF